MLFLFGSSINFCESDDCQYVYVYIYIQSYTVCVCIYIQYICVYIYIYWFTQAATHPAIRSLAFESLVQAPCGSTWKSELSDSMEMPNIPRWETCILRLVMARAVIAVVFFFFVLFALAGCSDRRLRLEKT